MADEHTHPGGDTGDTSMPDNEGLYGPGTGDLGSGPDEASGTGSPNTGKALVQKGAEAGIKKATGSDVAVSGLRGAQKARNGDIFGGAQDVAASGAGAATTAALTATGFGAPVAGAAGSAATSLVQTKAFRYGLIAVAALATFALVAQVMIVASVSTLMVSAIVPSTSQAGILSQTCVDSSTPSSGPEQVVGSDIEEKAWNYLRGAGYSEQQTAGALGSLEHESHFNPFIAEGVSGTPTVSTGWGMAQWTGSRHVAIRDAVIAELGDRFYVAAPSMEQLPDSMTQDDVDSMVLFQLRYIIDELEGTEKAAGDHLASRTTVAEATRSFTLRYERPGVVAMDERIAYAEDIYEQYAGSPVPDAGGTSTRAQTDTPSATMTPQDVASAVGASTGADCGGSSIAPSGDVGQVAECPSGAEGCVNIAALTKPSASLSCPDGTSDRGTTTAYYKGTGVQVRLCTLDGATDASGRPIIMNATIAPAFVAFWNEAKQAGIDLSFTSTYRSHAKQESLYASSPGGAARPGWSNHEFGMAFDIAGFPAPYSRHNCGSTQTPESACSYPGTGAQLERWKKIRALGLKHGMYIHDEEFWHIEFIPSGLHRGRNIDVHQG